MKEGVSNAQGHGRLGLVAMSIIKVVVVVGDPATGGVVCSHTVTCGSESASAALARGSDCQKDIQRRDFVGQRFLEVPLRYLQDPLALV